LTPSILMLNRSTLLKARGPVLSFLAVFIYVSISHTLEKYPETAPVGDFLKWLLDMLWSALAFMSLMVSVACLSLLVHNIFGPFRSLFIGRFRPRPIVDATIPSPAQLEAGVDEQNTSAETDTVSHHLFTPPSLVRCLLGLIFCGIYTIHHFYNTDMQLLKGVGVLEGIIIVLKYLVRGFAATSATLLLCVFIGAFCGSRRGREEEAAIAAELDEIVRARANRQTVSVSAGPSEKSGLAVAGEVVEGKGEEEVLLEEVKPQPLLKVVA